MLRMLLLVLAMSVATASACTTEKIICDYENVEEAIKEFHYYPNQKGVYKKVYMGLFTGDLRLNLYIYLASVPGDIIDGSVLLAPEHTEPPKTLTVKDLPNSKVIKRTYFYQEGELVRHQTIEYRIEKKYNRWYISAMDFT